MPSNDFYRRAPLPGWFFEPHERELFVPGLGRAAEVIGFVSPKETKPKKKRPGLAPSPRGTRPFDFAGQARLSNGGHLQQGGTSCRSPLRREVLKQAAR
jgi:hypothetical protein